MKHGCLRHLLKQQFTGSAICDLATSQHEGDRTTRAICQSVDFGGASTARSADSLVLLPPLPPDAQRCAFTAELSIRTCAGGPPVDARISKMSIQDALRGPPDEPVVQRLVRAIDIGCVDPAAAGLQYVHDATD